MKKMPTPQIQGLTVGLFLLILSGIIFSGMAGMESTVTYANVSPKAFPYGVGSAIFILALLLILQTLRGHFPHPPEGTDKAFDLWRTAVLLVVYIGGVALFEILGFVIVCTIFFAVTCSAVGGDSKWTYIISGLIPSVVMYWLFTTYLNVTLPGFLPILFD